MGRTRIRNLGINIGRLPTGKNNAITDVPGVLVGQVSIIQDHPSVMRTGVSVIVPRDGEIGKDYAFAGFHRFNGCGEFTGIQWIEESGLLTSAIALTNTQQIGKVRDALAEYSFTNAHTGPFYLPVVAETYDGWLNDPQAPHTTSEHVFEAMESAGSGAVDEGNVGGGTGMICHDFKGGIGSSSRLVDTNSGKFTVGALVQANYGDRSHLHVDGVPVGQKIGPDIVPLPWNQPPPSSSIIVILATDAPLLPVQCRRLAQRATTGISRVGGVGYNTSGDLFLAFATGHHIPANADEPIPLNSMIPNKHLDDFFNAAAEAVEESILNALTTAETMTGYDGRTAHALPLDKLLEIMNHYNRDS